MADMCKMASAYIDARYPDLTMRQIVLLGLICQTPGQSTATLAEGLDAGKPIITRATRTLARFGLISAWRSPDDGRKVVINPTLPGLALRQAFGAIGNG